MADTKNDGAVEGKVTDNLPANVMSQKGMAVRRDDFNTFITSKAAEFQDDPGDPLQRIIAQVLNAETPDAVLTPVDVKKAHEITGQPMVVLSYRLEKSDYDVGSPFFAVMEVMLGPGQEPEIVTCGHKKVMAQLVRLEELKAFPFSAEFIERGTSKEGHTPMLELRKVDLKIDEPPF